MSLPPRQQSEQQQSFLRQANLLRKNLNACEATLRSTHGEDWPSMLGRLNAAFVRAAAAVPRRAAPPRDSALPLPPVSRARVRPPRSAPTGG